MNFGMPTLVSFSSIEETAAFAAKEGLHFVELNMNLPYCSMAALSETDLQKIAHKYHLFFTLHADENAFFCDFNDRVSQEHLETMLDSIRLALKNHIPVINFHMSRGVYFTLPDQKVYLFEKYRDVYWKKLKIFREKCEELAEDKVRLCIENTGIKEEFIHQSVDYLLQSPSFSLTWDIGHDYTADHADTPFLINRMDRIRHIHLHDSKGKSCHLPLGQGECDWLKVVQSVVKAENIVLEVKTPEGIQQSMPCLKQHFPGSFSS